MSASLASKSLSHVTAAVFAIFITSSKKLWSDSRVSSWLSLKSPLISEHILHFHFTGFCFTALPCRTLGRSNVKITTNVPTHMWTLSPRDNIGVLCTMKEPTLHRQWMAICPVVIFFPLDAWITSNIWKKKYEFASVIASACRNASYHSRCSHSGKIPTTFLTSSAHSVQ